MKTTASQIQDLYAFTRKHFVEYYDLQTELVDHLANDIEAIRVEQPSLTFEQARTIAFKKFGVFGFSEIIEQRQKAMSRRYFRYMWKEFKQWFTIPKIVITATLFLSLFIMFSSNISKQFLLALCCISILYAFFKTIQLNRQVKRRKEVSQKKWLLEDIIFKQAGAMVLILISQIFNVVDLSNAMFVNYSRILIVSLLFTIMFLLMYISYQLLPKKAEELLKETYPEFSL